jgi:cholesterol oxidase
MPDHNASPTLGGHDFDVLIIGSGFGGSVTALRLVEKGYRVGVLEAGRRFTDDEIPKTNWEARKFLWVPKLGAFGMQRIHFLPDCTVLAGAGVGGGSLNYANTLYVPKDAFFEDPQWAGITDWKDELAPHYAQAEKMLGVTLNPEPTNSDKVMQKVAEEMGVGDTFVLTPVGVFFDQPGVTVPDPFFGGAGPERVACTDCGSCMTGCRHGAKNTLVKNYLYLAEQGGAQVFPLTEARELIPRPDGSWEVRTRHPGAWFGKAKRVFTARHVVLAAGTWGTQQLLHRMKDSGTLPKISDRLGQLTRTNSESILGAARAKVDENENLSQGVAITSSFHPEENTHIEPVRYGKGANAMFALGTLLTDGDGPGPRWLAFLRELARHPLTFLRIFNLRRMSERSIIVLVMQTLDNSITTFVKKGRLGRRLSSKQGHGEPNPTWIPKGNEAARRVAEKIGGEPFGSWPDVFNLTMTAHFIGGAPISDSPEHGVIDPYHRVWGYPTLFVADGAAVSANLGVNPSLSITAQAERAASLWPNKGEEDARPAQGQTYQRLDPIAPKNPQVPAHTPAALGWPTVRQSG